MLLTFALHPSSVLHPSRLVPSRSIPFLPISSLRGSRDPPLCTVLYRTARFYGFWLAARDAYVFRFFFGLPVFGFLLAACRVPFTVRCSRLTVYCDVPLAVYGCTVYGCTVCCLLFTVYRLRFTFYGLPFTVLPFTVCGFRFAVHGLSFYRLLFTVYVLPFTFYL